MRHGVGGVAEKDMCVFHTLVSSCCCEVQAFLRLEFDFLLGCESFLTEIVTHGVPLLPSSFAIFKSCIGICRQSLSSAAIHPCELTCLGSVNGWS